MMADLFTHAQRFLTDKGLPEPDSMKLLHHDRIELNYHRPTSDLPRFEWIVSNTGSHELAEFMHGGVLVSIYAQRAEVPA